MKNKFDRGRTAIRRTVHSRPIQLALDEGLIGKTSTILDYGCGRGDDVRMLRRKHLSAAGWDPVEPENVRLGGQRITNLAQVGRATYYGKASCRLLARKHDVVNLGFVLNVIEDPMERAVTLKRAWRRTRKVLLVAVRITALETGDRLAQESVNRLGWKRHSDGVVTSIGTFQKFYTHAELREYITGVLGRTPIMAAPGVAYVFRSRSLESLYLALRYPRPDHGPKSASKRGKKE